jgi:hypothetical protein
MKAWFGDHVLDLPERKYHAELALIDHEQRGAEQCQQDQQGGSNKSDSVHFVLP